MFYAELFTEQLTEELEVIICDILDEDCDTFTLVGDWVDQVLNDGMCKCAPYYWFDETSRTCLPIKNRLPHCVVGAELYGTSLGLGLSGATDLCALCEPGYV